MTTNALPKLALRSAKTLASQRLPSGAVAASAQSASRVTSAIGISSIPARQARHFSRRKPARRSLPPLLLLLHLSRMRCLASPSSLALPAVNEQRRYRPRERTETVTLSSVLLKPLLEK